MRAAWACLLLAHCAQAAEAAPGGALAASRRGPLACELCQLFALVGARRGAGAGDACRGGASPDWASLAARGGAGDDTLGDEGGLSLSLREQCDDFWRVRQEWLPSEGASCEEDSCDASSPAFFDLRQALCVDTFVCNAYTAWTSLEDEDWHLALGIPFAAAPAAPAQAPGAPDRGAAGADAVDGREAEVRELERRVAELEAELEAQLAGSAGGRRGLSPGDPLAPACPTEYPDDYADLRGVRAQVVLFAGRGSRLRILLPYLRRELRASGGVVERLIFALIRPDAEAMALIEEMRRLHPGAVEVRDYTEAKWGRPQADPSRHRMARLYGGLNEEDVIYVKVDDDIVYIAPHAIAELVREKLRDRCLFVSANVVNHAILSSVHQERGAHRAFEPASEDEQGATSRAPWRRVGDVNLDPSYVFERHPMGSCVLRRWDCAALAHESFLDRLSDGTLCAFDFGWLDFNRAGFHEHTYVHMSPWAGRTWEASGARWSINFFAFRAEDMRGADWSRVFGPGDDEEEFGGGHGERKGGHACALGRSLVVHFSYNTQEELLTRHTDLLDRYAALVAADETLRGLRLE